MTRLDQLLSALLADVTRARVRADEASRALADEYRRDPILQSFPIPRATLKQIDLDLVFATRSTGKATDAELLGARRKQELEKLARSSAGALIDILSRVEVRPRTALAASAEILTLGAAHEARPGRTLSLSFVSASIAKLLLENAGALELGTVFSALKSIGNEILTAETTRLQLIVPTAARSEFASARDRWAEELQKVAVDRMKTLAEEPTPPAIEVDISLLQEELATLPAHALSRMKLTLAVEDNEWVIGDENEAPRILPR